MFLESNKNSNNISFIFERMLLPVLFSGNSEWKHVFSILKKIDHTKAIALTLDCIKNTKSLNKDDLLSSCHEKIIARPFRDVLNYLSEQQQEKFLLDLPASFWRKYFFAAADDHTLITSVFRGRYATFFKAIVPKMIDHNKHYSNFFMIENSEFFINVVVNLFENIGDRFRFVKALFDQLDTDSVKRLSEKVFSYCRYLGNNNKLESFAAVFVFYDARCDVTRNNSFLDFLDTSIFLAISNFDKVFSCYFSLLFYINENEKDIVVKFLRKMPNIFSIKHFNSGESHRGFEIYLTFAKLFFYFEAYDIKDIFFYFFEQTLATENFYYLINDHFSHELTKFLEIKNYLKKEERDNIVTCLQKNLSSLMEKNSLSGIHKGEEELFILISLFSEEKIIIENHPLKKLIASSINYLFQANIANTQIADEFFSLMDMDNYELIKFIDKENYNSRVYSTKIKELRLLIERLSTNSKKSYFTEIVNYGEDTSSLTTYARSAILAMSSYLNEQVEESTQNFSSIAKKLIDAFATHDYKELTTYHESLTIFAQAIKHFEENEYKQLFSSNVTKQVTAKIFRHFIQIRPSTNKKLN